MKAVDSFGGDGGAGGSGIVSGMKRAGAIAVAALAVAALAGCGGGSKSVDELARDRFGADAGPCRVVALIELGKVYQCENGYGGVACVTRDGDDLFDVNTERYRITC